MLIDELRAEVKRLRAIRRSWIHKAPPESYQSWLEHVRPVKWWMRDVIRKIRKLERKQ